MLNILKMEWYRMFKSKSTWVILIIFAMVMALISALFSILMGNSDLARNIQKAMGMQEIVYVEDDYGNVIVNEEDAETEIDLTAEMPLYFQGNGFVLFIAIFMGIFSTGHASTGFRKNLAAITKNWRLVLSDIVMSLTFSFMMVAIAVLLAVPMLLISYKNVVMGNFAKLIVYLLVYLLLNAAFGMLGSLLGQGFRNRALAITGSLVWCCVLGDGVYYLVNLFVQNKLGYEDFMMQHYLPYGIITTLGTEDAFGRMGNAAFCGLIFIAVCTGITLLLTRRQDIK